MLEKKETNNLPLRIHDHQNQCKHFPVWQLACHRKYCHCKCPNKSKLIEEEVQINQQRNKKEEISHQKGFPREEKIIHLAVNGLL